MTKHRQLVVRIDDDLGEVLEETAKAFNRSRADVVCAALQVLAGLNPQQRREAIIAYVTRDIPGSAGGGGSGGKPGRKGYQPPAKK